MNLSIFFIILIFIALPFASGADLIFPFGQEYDIKRPCFNNGTFCDATFECNITVSYPDSSLLLDNRRMTNNPSFFNHTITASANNVLGTYPSIMSCTNGGVSGADTFNIIITGDGNQRDVFPIELSLIILGFVLIFVGKTKDDLRILQHVGGMMVMVFGVITLFPGFSGLNYTNLQGQALGFSTIGLGFYFLIENFFSRDKQVESFDQEDDGRLHD